MKKYILSLGVMLILSGCTGDYAELQRGVIENNQRVNTALDNYDKTQESANRVEQAIINAIYSKGTSNIDKLGLLAEKPELREELNSALLGLAGAYDTYITTLHMQIDEGILGEENRIKDRSDFIVSTTEFLYFLDDETGTTEQMILTQLPNGFVAGVRITWLGGNILEVKPFGLN